MTSGPIEEHRHFWRSGWRRLRERYSGTSGGSRLARAASWNVLGGAASRVLSFGASFLVARALGTSGFGQLGMLLNTFLMAGMFASFGLGVTATRFISLHRPASPERAARVAALAPLGAGILACLGAIFMLWMAPLLAEVALGNQALAPLMRLAAPLLLLGALQDSSQGVLAGLEAFRTLARVSAMAGMAQAVGMVIGARVAGLEGCVAGLVVGMASGYAVTFVAVQAELRRAGLHAGLDGWREEIPSLGRFALPVVLSGGVVLFVNWLVGARLIHRAGGDHESGLFNAAHQIRLLILYIPGLVATAGLPVLTHTWRHTSGGEYFRLIRLKLMIGFGIASLVAIPVMIGAPWILAAYGKGFSDASSVVRVLAGAAVITATLNMIGQSLVSEGRMWTGLLLNFVWACVLVSLAILWIPPYGALGLAWANLAAFGVHLVTVSLYVIRRARAGSAAA
ncbi:MAG: oligosaccharide flippase family protein [Verrucomicrobiales bacterium]|nr:oligosaccharide flippase family protein [Verrucomicrobiales bacterium]